MQNLEFIPLGVLACCDVHFPRELQVWSKEGQVPPKYKTERENSNYAIRHSLENPRKKNMNRNLEENGAL